MNQLFFKRINQIISILSKNKNLNFNHSQLPKFQHPKVLTPIGNFGHVFEKDKSKLPDSLINLSQLEKLVQKMREQSAMLRLSHIGFCYKVEKLEEEKERLIQLSQKSTVDLFQEPSNDDGLWLFLGDISNWQNPVTEFVPIAQTLDKSRSYWLPHIQIDIDTTLDERNIIDLVRNSFADDVEPFPIRINDTTYIIRNRLGCVDGINIFLDLATNKRNVPLLRQKTWQKIA